MTTIKWNDVSFDGYGPNKSDLGAVQESLNNVLGTVPGSRLFNPEFGCDLESILFEPCDESTADLIFMELNECLSRWDPRIKLSPAHTTVTPNPDENRFDIVLSLHILGVDERTAFQFSINSYENSNRITI